MPYFKNETVSDAFVQGMLAAYRAGVADAGHTSSDEGDAAILDRLQTQSVEQLGAAALGLLDGGASEPTVGEAIDASASAAAEDTSSDGPSA